jgi:hypothetical protein
MELHQGYFQDFPAVTFLTDGIAYAWKCWQLGVKCDLIILYKLILGYYDVCTDELNIFLQTVSPEVISMNYASNIVQLMPSSTIFLIAV